MDNTNPSTAHAVTPGDTENDPHLTVEDSGSTADASELGADDRTGAGHRHGSDHDAPSLEDGRQTGRAGLSDDSVGHVFDQTNGVIDGIDGDSDGTADSDAASAAQRREEPRGVAEVDPLGTDDSARQRDPNP